LGDKLGGQVKCCSWWQEEVMIADQQNKIKIVRVDTEGKVAEVQVERDEKEVVTKIDWH